MLSPMCCLTGAQRLVRGTLPLRGWGFQSSLDIAGFLSKMGNETEPFAVLPGDFFGIHCASKSQEQRRQCCLRAGQVRLSFLLFCISKSRKEAGYILWLFSGHALAPFSLVSCFQSQIGLDFVQESLVRLCKSVASSRARE